ncbi:hypothetical protein ACIA48_02210 [Mycobacterium sp. NPDC051804]|uniref:hypothetical protein n=1 Tax=Mycobacterium sp. NPDC051804 TaxID=3364295 RepID=UPI0037970265
MDSNYRAEAPRQFVAQPPFWGSKVASITTPAWQNNPAKAYLFMIVGVFAFTGVLWALFFGMQSLTRDGSEWLQRVSAYGLQFGLLLLLFGGVYGWTRWSRRRKIVISATSDGLSVTTRPGDVYPFVDAKLGTWGITGGATMGTALHLHCGSKRFVLGGRDRRVSAGTRLDAPDAGYGLPIDVDASLSSDDFDQLLAIVSSRSGLDTRRPGADEPTRCLLFTNSLKLQEIGSFSLRKQREFTRKLGRPQVAIDIGANSIRVIDPNTQSLLASVSPRQVSAQPVVFRPVQRSHWIPSLTHAMSDAATNYWSTSPGMRIAIPGMTPLTIGCRDTAMGLDFRFAWPDGVPTEQARADYEVSGTDWLTLVETFGLSSHLQARG